MRRLRSVPVSELVSKNKLFSGIIAAEFVWLFYMLLLLFAKPLRMEITAGDFMGTGARELARTEKGVGILGSEENEREAAGEELLLFYGNFALRQGAYEVTVKYGADYDGQKSAENVLGDLEITTQKNGVALKVSPIILRDGASEHTERMWLRSGGDLDDLRISVYYGGTGSLLIERVIIEESVLYRFVRAGGWFLLFVLLDLLYLCFAKNSILQVREETKWKILGLGSIVLVSSLTCFTDFVFDGHDMAFHMERIYRLAESLGDLQIPQRIAFRALNGYGYASPLLYGELFLYVPAFLYLLWVPLQTCYQLYIIGINLLTCLIAYRCFAQISHSWKLGIVGSCAYTLSAYRMINVLTRAAVGEYTAMAFYPLVCCGFMRIYQKEKDEDIRISDCVPLVIGMTGICESHVLSVEMSLLFLGAAALIYWKRTFAGKRLAALAKAAVLTILLNLWFLYPYVSAYFGMDMGTNMLGGNIEHYRVYPVQMFGDFAPTVTAFAPVDGMQGGMPLTLGISLILGALLFAVCLVKRESWKLEENGYYRQAGIFAAFAAAAVFLSSSFFRSGNLTGRWRIANILLGTLQFPWRMMAMATVFLCFVLVLGLAVLREKKGKLYCTAAAVLILLPGLLSTLRYETDFANAAEKVTFYSSGHAWQSPVAEDDAAWFQLEGSDNTLAYVRTPVAGEGVKVLSEVTYEAGTYSVDCANESGENSYIVLPVYNYDNFHAYDGEQMYEMVLAEGENRRISVELPAGYSGTLLLRYEVPVSWRICEAVSLLTLFYVCGSCLGFWKEKRKSSGSGGKDN